ncbi:hypothetical protein BOTBODRAFT_112065 [Botryobasidium botryosum FD-172 SS1]|uniref:G-patch domain-containing protein n=1 Tax=Botryobasidium botryosum (strain FD-172 SS1) TaxID=930990 RepID=A0A067MEA4_BOTB1|nr:hypothetical protein BOTBODRAFT_112065 [Botryobasidium botryosum FD-172 SS1]
MDEDEDEIPVRGFGASRTGGIGFSKSAGTTAPSTTPGESPSPAPAAGPRGGIGSRAGLGASTSSSFAAAAAAADPTPSSIPPSAALFGLPSAFGAPASERGAPRAQRSFLRNGGNDGAGSAGTGSRTPLSAAEQQHFNKIQGTYGAKLMAKMGWQAGTGLGASAQGIVTPIETKLRPKNMGIAFKGFKEKTEQSKAEARRRGEAVSDDDEPRRGKGKGKDKGKSAEQGDRSDAWKKPRKTKTRVEHKTYEQIVQEAGYDAAAPGIGPIIDATGATPREVSSMADLATASWTPSTDPMRLPEVRHNLRLIVDVTKGDLDGLAKEAKALEERKKWLKHEDQRLRKSVAEEAELISRLQKVHLVVEDISVTAKEAASLYEASLQSFTPHFEKLYGEYSKEYDAYGLDEIVVAAIVPVFRRSVSAWDPLKDPTELADVLRQWKKILKVTVVKDPGSQLSLSSVMTPFESLLWNVWLPKVRSAINNDWSPKTPTPLVQLFEAWSDVLPQFMIDNILDQLVLPKVQKAVSDWSSRRDKTPLHTLVFPWLPHIGLRVEELLGDARRKVKSLFRSWAVDEGVPQDLLAWKDVFDSSDWQGLLLKYVVPKLGATLRDDFKINPRNQNMDPLNWVLPWAEILRPSIFSHLLEAEFFPKWLDILHIWLVQPNPSFDEVAQWYSFWKGSFPESVLALPEVRNGFTKGLQMMNEAMELGSNAPMLLPRPEPYQRKPDTDATSGISKSGTVPARPKPTEVTFRSIVEDFAASHNLLFLPTGKTHEKSRMPLYRVSQNIDGKGGLSVYILDDVVWADDGGDYRAISLEDMVLRATKIKR